MNVPDVRVWTRMNFFCRAARYFSSDDSDAATKIKKLRFRTQRLFGAVVGKEDVNKTATVKPHDESRWQDVLKERQSPKATEMFWLAGPNVRSKRIKIIKSASKSPSASSAPTPPPSDDTAIDTALRKNTKRGVISTGDILREFVHIKANATIAIPFDDHQLKSISMFPMECQKATTAQIDAALKSNLPSISKILTATMPEAARFILKKWKLGKIAELGEDGFQEYQRETFRIGQMFHSSVEEFLEHRIMPGESSDVYKLWRSVGDVLVELDPKPMLTEKSVVHPELKYKGIIDSVAVVKLVFCIIETFESIFLICVNDLISRDTMCALEWKTSEKSKPVLSSTYDAPIQLCAYIGALNIDPRYEISARNGYVVVAYKDGTKANAFYLSEKDVRKYWAKWLQRVHEFWIRTRDGTIPEPI